MISLAGGRLLERIFEIDFDDLGDGATSGETLHHLLNEP